MPKRSCEVSSKVISVSKRQVKAYELEQEGTCSLTLLLFTKSRSTTQAEKRKISKYSLSKVGFKNVTLQNFLASNSMNTFAELHVGKIFCQIMSDDGTFDLPNDDDVNVSWSLCWRVILAPPRVLCPNTNKYRTPLLA